MPTAIVGLNAALAAIIGAIGLAFLIDPCGGGGDLCLGGILGLSALGFAALGGIGLVVWKAARRASPLLVWDAAVVAMAGFAAVTSGGYGPSPITLAAALALVAGVPAAVVAGRAVAPHRVERVLAVVALLATGLLGVETGAIVATLGVLAMAIGWATRPAPATASPADAPAAAEPEPEQPG